MTQGELFSLLQSLAPEGVSLIDDTKFATFLDSLDFLEYQNNLEDKLNTTLPNDFFDDTETVGQLLAKLSEYLNPKEVIENGMLEERQRRKEEITLGDTTQ